MIVTFTRARHWSVTYGYMMMQNMVGHFRYYRYTLETLCHFTTSTHENLFPNFYIINLPTIIVIQFTGYL